MTGPEHFRRAEEFAAKAGEYLGHGDGQESAALWAAVAQVHATLALAAASQSGLLRPASQADRLSRVMRRPVTPVLRLSRRGWQ
jgi:hypothetical protein